MKNGIEETGLNYIYSKSYNFVYMRAKAILGDEQAARVLMQEVYTAFYKKAEKTKVEALYEELGRNVYRMGCECVAKKKQKEARILTLSEEELKKQKIEMTQEELETAWDVLEKMPDMYFATAIAFYYDYLAIDEIAELFDCTPNAVRYRLNYMRRCLEDVLKEGQRFSAPLVCTVIRAWATEHCMGMTGAQNTYAEICEIVELKSTPVYLAGKDFAGVNHTVVYRPQHDWDSLLSELEPEAAEGDNVNKRHLVYTVAGILLVCLILAIILIMMQGKGKAEQQAPKSPKIEQTTTSGDDTATNKQAPSTQPTQNEPTQDESTQPTQAEQTQPTQDEPTQATANEYIFADSDKVLISTSQLQKCTKAQLRLARNEIYARYGVVFGVKDLDEYFASKSWYTEKMSITDFYKKVEMNEIEERNIIRIQKVEQSK